MFRYLKVKLLYNKDKAFKAFIKYIDNIYNILININKKRKILEFFSDNGTEYNNKQF